MPVQSGGYNRWEAGTPGSIGGRFAPKDAAAVGRGVDRRSAGGKAPGPRPPGRARAAAGMPADLSKATVRTLTAAARRISAQPPGTPGLDAAILAIDAELARREGVDRLAATDTPQSRQVDDLMRRGWSYLDAYAEVNHKDPAELHRQQRMADVERNRRPGERRATTINRMYAEWLVFTEMQAERETRGVLLNRAGIAKNVDPGSLWFKSAAWARRYASDELKEWWSNHGGRVTPAEYRTQFTGDRARAERERAQGQGRDWGV